MKKNAGETCCLLEEDNSDHEPSKTTRKDWFKSFKSENFDIVDKLKTPICKLYGMRINLQHDNASCYHLFRSMARRLARLHLANIEEVQNCFN